jgi:hypothetical protein
MHLLLMAYPPPVEDNHDYRYLLNGCLAAGFDCAEENGAGLTSLFVFCDRLSNLQQANHPDCVKIVKCLVQHSASRKYGSDSNPGEIGGVFTAIERKSRHGKSVFDIEHSSTSCLRKCIEMFRGAMSDNSVSRKLQQHQSRTEDIYLRTKQRRGLDNVFSVTSTAPLSPAPLSMLSSPAVAQSSERSVKSFCEPVRPSVTETSSRMNQLELSVDADYNYFDDIDEDDSEI